MRNYIIGGLKRKSGIMRVMVLGIVWPPETFLFRLLSGLQAAGFSFIIASAQKPDAGKTNGLSVQWVFTPSASRLPALLAYLPFAILSALRQPRLAFAVCRTILRDSKDCKLKRLVKNWFILRRRFDLVYFPWLLSAGDFSALMTAGMPGLLSCRGAHVNIAPFNPFRPGVREILSEAFKLARRVHCVSNAILLEAMALGLPKNKAVVIPPAVDTDFFKPANSSPKSEDSFNLITTGLLIWRKGLEFALTAVSLLEKSGIPVRLTLIGKGPERQRILYTAEDLGLGGRIHLAGALPPESVLSHLHKSDVFLLSSLSEGICNAVLEAMACGLPVVTTDCGGMPEAVTHGVEGFLVAPQDPEATAKALTRIYRDETLRKEMARAARSKILKKFALPTQIKAFRCLAEEAVSGGSRIPH